MDLLQKSAWLMLGSGRNSLGVSQQTCRRQRFNGATCKKTGLILQVSKCFSRHLIGLLIGAIPFGLMHLHLDCKRWWNLLAKHPKKPWWVYAEMGILNLIDQCYGIIPILPNGLTSWPIKTNIKLPKLSCPQSVICRLCIQIKNS
jgi:hypothetical protein